MSRGGPVLGRVVAGDRALEAGELDDDEAVERPRPLEDPELAAARQDRAAEFPDDRRRQIGVLLVLLGVVDLRARDPIGDHLVLPSRLHVSPHSCCGVRHCLARTGRPMPNCLRLIGSRYQRYRLRMVAAANLVEVAALVGDTARATMLSALMGGQSLTATQLAYCANVSRSTASGHLSMLVAARLLTVTRERRFSYYRIASPLVATML